eukprot:TRINITY_DN3616_c1_g1_i3.p1 TRINITY_DN3616_c1_g1~~TRINITY_DN3616_c1_g1_i3.p1  ORF type:complete len:382 (+),score=86.09 TRINITY_DN3616_c1_g1_i3:35-1147(+)
MDATQIISVEGEDFHFYPERLTEVVSAIDPTLPVKIIAVVGQFRGGKSTLENVFLDYLIAQRKSSSWRVGKIPKPSSDVGFKYRNGSERMTNGLWISEGFVIDGEAIFIVDSQGLFDDVSSAKVNSMLFCLSALLSSMLIVNTRTTLDSQAISQASCFIGFAKLALAKWSAAKGDTSSKPFQGLQFLIRDTPIDMFEDHSQEEIRVENNSRLTRFQNSNAADTQEAVEILHSTFEQVSCYHLPHPGNRIDRNVFDGDLTNLDPFFVEQLNFYVRELFNSLQLKSFLGASIRVGSLVESIANLTSVFREEIPSPDSMVNMAAEMYADNLHREAIELYKEEMKRHQFREKYIEAAQAANYHDAAVSIFCFLV